MKLVHAVRAFIDVLMGSQSCEHPKVDLTKVPSFCPDCGYEVAAEWVMLHCRQCDSRRVPKRTLTGQVQAVDAYCRHCGYDRVKLVKKPRVEAYELIYAVCQKRTVFEAEKTESQNTPYTHTESWINNPFQTSAFVDEPDIVDAEVIDKQEFTGPQSRVFGDVFRTDTGSSFGWQTRPESGRYQGASYTRTHQQSPQKPTGGTNNIVPIRKTS